MRRLKSLFILFLLLAVSATIAAQEVSDDEAKEIIRSIALVKGINTFNVQSLAGSLTKKYDTDREKALAIAFWIMKNIRYDYKAYLDGNPIQTDTRKILFHRKAVCSGYSLLFKELCNKAGLDAEVIPGYTREFDFFPGDTLFSAQHMWSMVRVGDSWKLLDLTWGGSVIVPKKQRSSHIMAHFTHTPVKVKFRAATDFDLKWVFVDPELMIKTHCPIAANMQMLSEVVPIDTFRTNEERIVDYLNYQKITKAQNAYLDRYSFMNETDKYKYMIAENPKYNSRNHRETALYYSRMLEKMVSDSYNKEKRQYLMDTVQKAVFDQLLATTYIYIDSSLNDNNSEFNFYKVRNSDWHNRVKAENQELKKLVAQQKKQYTSNLKQARKNKERNQRVISSIDDKKTMYKELKLVPDPENRVGAGTYDVVCQSYIENYGALIRERVAKTNRIDSILNSISSDDQEMLIDKEMLCHSGYRDNNKELMRCWVSDITSNKIYTTLNPNKDWYRDNVQQLSALSAIVTDSVLLSLYNNLSESYNLFKDIYNNYKTEFKLQARLLNKGVLSNDQMNEFGFRIVMYRQMMENYQKAYENYLIALRKYEIVYRRNNKILRKSNQLLEKDKAIEDKRFKRYTTYRKHKKDNEVVKINDLKKHIKELNSSIVVLEPTSEKEKKQDK